ncbi:hypothetical protein CJF30_00004427 [Rutstroemia sp. NJR-2017a BBW]|nr:hypothetical protein CJF30_00004427 [Rutstroemia sp. NJR-2017a BBW]
MTAAERARIPRIKPSLLEIAIARSVAACIGAKASAEKLSVEKGRSATYTARGIVLGWLQGK